MTCVCFLRGINVGGRTIVKMDRLKQVFESLGFGNVETIAASGNVVFDSPERSAKVLEQKISAGLKAALGIEIGVFIRTLESLRRLFKSDPFRSVRITPETRLLVSFLSEGVGLVPASRMTPSGSNYRIVASSKSEICSALILSPGQGTPELMAALEKIYGRAITTRAWSVVEKIVGLRP